MYTVEERIKEKDNLAVVQKSQKFRIQRDSIPRQVHALFATG